MYKLRGVITQAQDLEVKSSGKVVDHLDMKFGVNKYGTQFNNNEEKWIHPRYEQNSCGCDIHANYIQ